MTDRVKQDEAKQEERDHAKEQAEAQVRTIVDLVEALEEAKDLDDYRAIDEARERMYENLLSVEYRSSEWRLASDYYRQMEGGEAPDEYRAVLCTGGPHVEIVGGLTEHGEPASFQVQYNDWFRSMEKLSLSPREEKAVRTYLLNTVTFYG